MTDEELGMHLFTVGYRVARDGKESTDYNALGAEVNRLIADDKVKIEFERTEDGLTVKFVSDDPELSKKLQEMMPNYIKSLQEAPAQPRPQPVIMQRRQAGPNQGGEIDWVIGGARPRRQDLPEYK